MPPVGFFCPPLGGGRRRGLDEEVDHDDRSRCRRPQSRRRLPTSRRACTCTIRSINNVIDFFLTFPPNGILFFTQRRGFIIF